MTTVVVVDQQEDDSGPFEFGASYRDGSLNEVIDSLLAIRESVPPEYRERARCEISAGLFYDSPFAQIRVSFERPELPDETAEREANERELARKQEESDRARYEELKRKFG